MTNALATPPAPNPNPQQPAGTNALAPARNAPAGAQGASQMQAPPPSAAQTIAAMRHFHQIEMTIEKLMMEPETGKADMKSEVIDAVTRLVANGFMSPAEAVSQLGTFPERPFDQKKWLEQHYMDVISSAEAVLAHHGAAFQGQDIQAEAPAMDKHLGIMSGLMAQYKGGMNG